MKPIKKRHKKFNPHKLQHRAVSQHAQEVNALYSFEATYNIETVLEKLLQLSRGTDGVLTDLKSSYPDHIVLEAYDQQDLILAVNQRLVQTPEYWEVSAQAVYYNYDTEVVTDVPFYVELPRMTYSELIRGSHVKVKRESGFTTRWGGLNNELRNFVADSHVPAKSLRIQTNVCLRMEAHFIDASCYDLYHSYLKLRDMGALLPVFKQAYS